MAPTGAYLDFVLDVIPYPQHHDPEHGLGETQNRAAHSRVHVNMPHDGINVQLAS